MTSPKSEKQKRRAFKNRRREFWRRCKEIYARNANVDGDVIYVRVDGFKIRITVSSVGAWSKSVFRASVQFPEGGIVHGITESEPYDAPGGQNAIERALPALRGYMILDDLAGL